MDGYGVCDHGKIGGKYLKDTLNCKSNNVISLVSEHINAKRYLVFKKGESYYNSLSKASQKTLEFQGGPMNENETQMYEKQFNKQMIDDIVKIRYYDDIAKNENMKCVPLSDFIPLLNQYF